MAPAAGSRSAQPRAQQLVAAEDVQRQITVATVVTVEEAALLHAMQRIVRRVQVQPDLPRRLAVRPHEQPDQQVVERLRLRHDALVAMYRRLRGVAQLQTVQRARTRQRRTPIALPHPARARRIHLARRQRQQRVAAQFVVIVEVLVTQRQRVHALRQQRAHVMLDARRVAVIDETPGQPFRQPDALVHFAKQQTAAVGTHVPTVEAARYPAPSKRVKIKLIVATLCVQGCFLFVWRKRLIAQPLCHRKQPSSTPSVRYPG